MLRHNGSRFCETIVGMAKTHKQLLAIVAVFVFLQFYFVRELIAAEFLFGTAFAVFLVLAVILYAVGAIGARSVEWSEAGVKVIAHSTHLICNRFHLPSQHSATWRSRRSRKLIPDGRMGHRSVGLIRSRAFCPMIQLL